MPCIERHAYADPTVFAAELEALFGLSLFAGTRFDFHADDCYRSLSLGRRRITVRRTPDGVAGFGNVCLHRNALIDPKGYGQRPFRCPYHGWRYARDGSLAEAPMTDMGCIGQRQLPTYPVSECEGLYLLGANGHAPPTDEVRQALHASGVVLAAPFHRDGLLHACNWKLLVENVLEGYHLSFVHAQTFRPSGFTSAGAYRWEGGEYTSTSLLEPTAAHDKSAQMRRLSPDAGHYYRHGYIFPDLFVSNTNGLIGFLSHLVPVSANETRLEWQLSDLPAMAALPAPVQAQIRAEAIQFTRDALLEDKALVESCQEGLDSDGPDVQLQPVEARLAHFHSLYTRCMPHV